MSKLQIFTYNNHAITFDFGTDAQMINATEMAKPFGKRPSKFLEIAEVKKYIQYLEENSDVRQAVITVRGNFKDGRPQGTWMHKLLALRCAQWLDVRFAIWVDERIEELLKKGYTQLSGLWIYFFQSSATQTIKIGKTYDLQKRKRRVENSHGHEVKLLKAIKVPDESYERAIQKQFKHLRLKGEWFRLAPDLQQYIDNLPNHLQSEGEELRSENTQLRLKNMELNQQISVFEDFRKMVLGQVQELKTQQQSDQNSLKESQSYNQLLRDLLQMDVTHWLNEPLNQSRLVKNLRTELMAYRRQLAWAWLHIVQTDSLMEVMNSYFQSEMPHSSPKNRENFAKFSLLIHRRLKGKEGWIAFAKYFEQCHPNLLDRLQVRFPNLNSNDLKYCSYILMELTNDDMALLFGVTESSMKQIGGRLRRKLGIISQPIEIADYLRKM